MLVLRRLSTPRARLRSCTRFRGVTAPAFISAILAVPVATLALWRARLVTWWLPLVAAAAFLGPNFLPVPALSPR